LISGGSQPLANIQAAVEAVLSEFLAAKRAFFLQAAPQSVEAIDELTRSIFAGGKRLRPGFCYCGFIAGGGPHGPEILAAAASLELLHTLAIVHDDVIDASPLRRAEPSTFVHIARQRRGAGVDEDAAKQAGVGAAILVGDLSLVLSDALFVESGFPADALARAWKPLTDMRLAAIAGQYLDAALPGRSGFTDLDPENARRIARLKTARYSIEGPLLFGAALAGGGPGLSRALSAFGTALGEAFQIADDLEAFGAPEAAHETDLRLGRPTLLVAEALRLAAPQDRELISAAWGNRAASDSDLEHAEQAIHRSGAPGECIRLVRSLVAEAKKTLKTFATEFADESALVMLDAMADLISNSIGDAIESPQRTSTGKEPA
jgi:geranylgeranyl diphosphate synthase type I